MSNTQECVEIKEAVKQEVIDYKEVSNTLEDNIDAALQTGSLGIAGIK